MALAPRAWVEPGLDKGSDVLLRSGIEEDVSGLPNLVISCAFSLTTTVPVGEYVTGTYRTVRLN